MTPQAVFFDIGGTLADYDAAADRLVPLRDAHAILTLARDVLGLRIGVITTLGSLTLQRVRQLMEAADLADFVDPHWWVSEHEAGVAKPDPQIYRFAAQQLGVPAERCLFVGENFGEILGATCAGMQGMQKTSLPQ